MKCPSDGQFMRSAPPAPLCRSLPRSVVLVSCGDAGFTRRHTPGDPLPDLAQRLRVENRPPAHREGPCLNQVQDVSVFGEFLRPVLGDRIGLPPTVPIAGTFGPSLPQEPATERIRESPHTIISPPACMCMTATILPPFGHLAAAFVSHGRIAGAQVHGMRWRHDDCPAPALRAAHAHSAGDLTQGYQIRSGYPARLPMSAYRCLCTPLGRGCRERAWRDGVLPPPLPWS
jgi:hypothetical protein